MLESFDKCVDLAEKGDHIGLFQLLEEMCRDLVGVKLFTCMTFDMTAGVAQRIYTNDAEAYPTFGEKPIEPNRWTQLVLDQRKPFLARSVVELRDIFPDHRQIEALGIGATINLPVVVNDRVLGTINLLDKDGCYSDGSIAALAPVRLPAIVAFSTWNAAIGQVEPEREGVG